MTRVFLTVELPESAAYRANLGDYGELVYIFDEIPNIWSSSIEEEILDRIEEKSFDPDLDFYAVSGIMPLSHITLSTLVEEYGAIKTLLWDRSQHIYREKEIGGLVG